MDSECLQQFVNVCWGQAVAQVVEQGHLLNGRLVVDPCLLQSSCQISLDKILEVERSMNACECYIYKALRKSVEKSACGNG